MRVDLLRHGTPQGGRLYRGNQDDPLTEEGWQQMRDSTQGKSWNSIATSPLLRCFEFAQQLANKQKVSCQVVDDFQEIGFGEWQGRSAKDIGQITVDAFKANPVQNQPSGAENLYDFQTRVLRTFKQLTQNKPVRQSLLIVAHAGVIRAIKSHLLQQPIEKMFLIKVATGACEQFEI